MEANYTEQPHESKAKGGWVRIHRDLLNHPRYRKDSEWVHVWMHLLLNARFSPAHVLFNGRQIMLKPGQLISNRHKIAAETGVHHMKVFRILEQLKTEHQIEQQAGSKESLFTVLGLGSGPGTEQQNEQQLNNSRTTDEQQTPASANKDRPSSASKKGKKGENCNNVPKRKIDAPVSAVCVGGCKEMKPETKIQRIEGRITNVRDEASKDATWRAFTMVDHSGSIEVFIPPTAQDIWASLPDAEGDYVALTGDRVRVGTYDGDRCVLGYPPVEMAAIAPKSPTDEEVAEFFDEEFGDEVPGAANFGATFFNMNDEKGWILKKRPMEDWKQAARNFIEKSVNR